MQLSLGLAAELVETLPTTIKPLPQIAGRFHNVNFVGAQNQGTCDACSKVAETTEYEGEQICSECREIAAELFGDKESGGVMRWRDCGSSKHEDSSTSGAEAENDDEEDDDEESESGAEDDGEDAGEKENVANESDDQFTVESSAETESEDDDYDEGSEDEAAVEKEGHSKGACADEASEDKLADAAAVSLPTGSAVVHAVSLVLAQVMLLGRPTHCTVFDSRVVPTISIPNYLSRLHKYFKCSEACILMGLIYLDRLLKLYPDFVASRQNIHRLVLACVVVGTKFHEDSYYSNDYFARVGGIPTKELNNLEAKLMHMLEWRVHIIQEEYDDYRSNVLRAVSG